LAWVGDRLLSRLSPQVRTLRPPYAGAWRTELVALPRIQGGRPQGRRPSRHG